ncbi:MAG: hypothetical protein AAGN66_11505 [Acidobacteriota bacterium]
MTPPSPSVALLHLLRARWRMARRRVADAAFPLFILGPILLGAAAWIGERYLHLGRPLLAAWLASNPGVAGPAFALAVSLALWPGTVGELYGRGRDLLDALSVGEGVRFAATATALGVRSAIPTLVVLGVLIASTVEGAPPRTPALVAGLLAAGAYLSFLVLLLAPVLVRFGWATSGRLLVLGGLLVGGAALGHILPGDFLPGETGLWLLAPWWPAARVYELALGQALAVTPADPGAYLQVLAFLPPALALAALPHRRWRRGDLETALALDLPQRRGFLTRLGRLAGWVAGGGEPVRSLLRRDVLLVLRRFSAAVPIAVGLGLAVNAGVAATVVAAGGTELWVRRLVVGGPVLAVLTVTAIVPFLLAHQLPRLWLERTHGVQLEHVWQTKLRLAAVLAVPPMILGLGIVVTLTSGGPWERGAAGLQFLAAAAVVPVVVGLSVFEIADQPILGLVFASLVALAMAALMVLYPAAWWLWLIAYGWVASLIAGRASRRVRFTEVPR